MLLGLLVLGLLPPMTQAQSRQEPIHGELTRFNFEAAKGGLLNGNSGLNKDGGLGDAAVTSDRYDVLRCGLDLRVDPDAKTLAGTVQMVVACRVASLQEVVFDLSNTLDIESVQHLSGSLPVVHAADSVIVTLPVALGEGQVDSFVVHYGGQPIQPIINRGLMYKRHHDFAGEPPENAGPIVANVSQPAYAQYWWPCKDRPDDKFLATVRLVVPDTLVGVSNGTLVDEGPADPGWKAYTWRESYPIASYLVSIAVSDYVLMEEECQVDDGSLVSLRNWVFPPDLEDAQVDFAPLCDMMGFAEGLFGAYPFQGEKYGHAEFVWPGGMEHQTVTSIGSTSIRGDGSRDWLIVHELGHQWFGDSLTPEFWADIWLNEGFATYSEALWYEQLQGTTAYHQYLADSFNPEVWARQGPMYDPFPVFPGRVIYDKGSWLLHSLRGRMGDTAFFGLLEDWAQGGGRPLHSVTTQEFIDLAGTWASEDLNAFFWPYLEETVLPLVDVDYHIVDGPSGTDSRVELELRQLQEPLFDNVFPIVITTASGPTDHELRLSGTTAAATYDLAEPVLSVTVDPERWVMWLEPAPPTARVGITRIYPNPSQGAYVYIEYHLAAPATVVLRIFDAVGHEIAVEDLGLVTPESDHNDVVWNEKDRYGVRVPSGVYWAALEIAGSRSVGKLTVLR